MEVEGLKIQLVEERNLRKNFNNENYNNMIKIFQKNMRNYEEKINTNSSNNIEEFRNFLKEHVENKTNNPEKAIKLKFIKKGETKKVENLIIEKKEEELGILNKKLIEQQSGFNQFQEIFNLQLEIQQICFNHQCERDSFNKEILKLKENLNSKEILITNLDKEKNISNEVLY